MNSITELLDLEDVDISITDIRIEGRKKFLSLETKLEAHFCPCCGFKMYSRGIKRSKISHPVLQDFHTGDPIDLLRSRKKDVTEPYFASIPLEERKRVRYLLSDMYNPYISFVDKYFPNAVPVVDSFHVIQWVVHSIDMYIRQLERKYRQRDRELQEERSAAAGRPVRLPESDEMYMLRKYRWLVLSNRENIVYHHHRQDQYL